MRIRAWAAVSVALVVTLMIVGTLVTVSPTVGGDGTSLIAKRPDPEPRATGSSAKVVVLEVFTGTWCPPCANADPAVSRVMDEYSPDDLLILMYHLNSPDPYINAASNARATFYNIRYVPTAIVDGGGPYVDDTLWLIGAFPQKSQNYDLYRQMIDSEPPSGAPLEIALDADLTPTTASAIATIHATDPITLANLQARFVLYEDALYHMGSNGEPYHRGVVRDMRAQPLAIARGETVTLSETFTLQGGWNRNKLGIAVMVQTNDQTAFTISVGGTPYTGYDAEVLNSARADFVEPGIDVYRDEPLTDYQEPFERLLSQERMAGQPGYHFRTYNVLSPMDRGTTDVRGPPQPAALAESPMLVWFTGSQGAGATLDPSEQTVIESFLADGNGHLLLSGENIGSDIGTTMFYQNVLRSSFGTDIAGGVAVQGVTGDPISGPWATASLSFAGSSPDGISAQDSGAVSFQYRGSSQGAAVRSDFDSDSRVLYMGFTYFQGTDGSRKEILGSAIRWFDAKSGPAVGVGWPNGGETLAPGTPYRLEWSARDVEVPANGVDVYFTSDSSNPTWTLIASGQPNDGVLWWTPPAGVDSPLCRLRVVVRDSTGNAGEDLSDADFTIGSPVLTPFSVILQPGLNLVSFPVTPIGSGLTSVLSTVDPWYRAVWTYDPATATWTTWHRGGQSNRLGELDLTMGFWIDVTSSEPLTLALQGVPPLSTSIPLARGWNLVGFPSSRTDITVAEVKAATGATAIVGFGPTGPGYTRFMADTETLVAGSGYFIHVNSPATWVVSYT
jgi:thiol-disulfide isomerase/thioredoxin